MVSVRVNVRENILVVLRVNRTARIKVRVCIRV